ncbi:hypothetical protein EYZ11_010462 [Aspergillus tanneri]|uniref:Uncharacterized protein n=1 Tax=Aspergillus tanneri TaxID=1220188 RepID=A0A4S3J5A0_9EURO|nr:hypothetical protein EYZ11_010462 [Aspergillus tanneri]
MSTTIPLDRLQVAIAEVVIFSIIQVVQFATRYIQEWRYWHHGMRKSLPRCFFYSWCGLLGVLAQRISNRWLGNGDIKSPSGKVVVGL